jgi:hypothetical protein
VFQQARKVAARAARASAEEVEGDDRDGADRRGDEIPAALARRRSRLDRIQAAKHRLDQRQAAEDRSRGREPGKKQLERNYGESPRIANRKMPLTPSAGSALRNKIPNLRDEFDGHYHGSVSRRLKRSLILCRRSIIGLRLVMIQNPAGTRFVTTLR